MRLKPAGLLLFVIGIFVPSVQMATFMESLRNFFQSSKYELDENGISYPEILDGVRRQQRISSRVPFPCDTKLGRSTSPPDNVNRLRPGDIDIVGGLGDSLVAGSGALEEFAIGTFIEARGVSWCAGGQGDWRKFLTLPNFIKEFNKNLTGFATGTGEFISAKAALNVAFPVAATEDALHQARILVRRIRSNPKMDFKKHWKLITILFGANDICSAQCYSPKNFSPIRYALHLRRALDYLRAVMPRTLVNLVPAIDVTVSVRVTRTMMCNILHPLYCACMHEGKRPDIQVSKMAKLYQDAAEALVKSGRYDTTKDFAVVLQPFTKLFNAPNSDPQRAPPMDANLVTYDCFHFSQRGHALECFPIDVYETDSLGGLGGLRENGEHSLCERGMHGANLLWNNMFEPVGNKTDSGLPEILERVVCPTENLPYIFTNVNSRNYRETGSQEGIMPR